MPIDLRRKLGDVSRDVSSNGRIRVGDLVRVLGNYQGGWNEAGLMDWTIGETGVVTHASVACVTVKFMNPSSESVEEWVYHDNEVEVVS